MGIRAALDDRCCVDLFLLYFRAGSYGDPLRVQIFQAQMLLAERESTAKRGTIGLQRHHARYRYTCPRQHCWMRRLQNCAERNVSAVDLCRLKPYRDLVVRHGLKPPANVGQAAMKADSRRRDHGFGLSMDLRTDD